MFEKYKGTIDIEEVLKNKYNYDFHGDMKDLASEEFIEIEGNGVDALFWIIYDDERYLFKPIKSPEYNIWGELLSEKIANSMNISCAQYRVAKFNNQLGVITKNFLQKDETLIMGDELFQNFFNNYPYPKETENLIYDKNFRELYQIPEEYTTLGAYDRRIKTFTHLNNLMDTWSITETLIKNKNVSASLIQNLLKMIIFDCITLQGDRHPNNWAYIKDENNNYKNAPLYDNSAAFGLGYPYMQDKVNDFKGIALNMRYQGTDQIDRIINNIKPSFTLENDDINSNPKSKTNTELFNEIIADSDKELKEYIINTLENLNEDNIESMITEIEEENNIKMDNSLHFYITFLLEYNLKSLKEIVNKYQKDNENEHTRGTK